MGKSELCWPRAGGATADTAMAAAAKAKAAKAEALPSGARILLIDERPADEILNGLKDLEIRGVRCRKPAGTQIFLAKTKVGGVHGHVKFMQSVGPLSALQWESLRSRYAIAHRTAEFGLACALLSCVPPLMVFGSLVCVCVYDAAISSTGPACMARKRTRGYFLSPCASRTPSPSSAKRAPAPSRSPDRASHGW